MVPKKYRERKPTIQTTTKNLKWKNSRYYGLTGDAG